MGSIRGDKKLFISHLNSKTGPCKHASLEVIEAAKAAQSNKVSSQVVTIAGLKHQSGSINVSTMGSQLQPLKKLKQTDLTTHVFQGIDIPFSPGETAAIEAQALWATISAKGAFQSWDDPKVKKLFWLFQSAAPSVLPSAKVVSVRLLNEAVDRVQSKMTKKLKGQLVGLK